MLKEDCLYLSIFQKHGATSSDMSKNEEEMLLPSEENIIMEEEFYPSATYARGQRNTTAGKSNCRFSSSGMFLSSPSACRTSGASKNRDYRAVFSRRSSKFFSNCDFSEFF